MKNGLGLCYTHTELISQTSFISLASRNFNKEFVCKGSAGLLKSYTLYL